MKVELINRLAEAGVGAVEATSFVSPKWVPQLADSAEVMSSIKRLPGVRYPVLTPNMKVRAAGFCHVPLSPNFCMHDVRFDEWQVHICASLERRCLLYLGKRDIAEKRVCNRPF